MCAWTGQLPLPVRSSNYSRPVYQRLHTCGTPFFVGGIFCRRKASEDRRHYDHRLWLDVSAATGHHGKTHPLNGERYTWWDAGSRQPIVSKPLFVVHLSRNRSIRISFYSSDGVKRESPSNRPTGTWSPSLHIGSYPKSTRMGAHSNLAE